MGFDASSAYLIGAELPLPAGFSEDQNNDTATGFPVDSLQERLVASPPFIASNGMVFPFAVVQEWDGFNAWGQSSFEWGGTGGFDLTALSRVDQGLAAAIEDELRAAIIERLASLGHVVERPKGVRLEEIHWID